MPLAITLVSMDWKLKIYRFVGLIPIITKQSDYWSAPLYNRALQITLEHSRALWSTPEHWEPVSITDSDALLENSVVPEHS